MPLFHFTQLSAAEQFAQGGGVVARAYHHAVGVGPAGDQQQQAEGDTAVEIGYLSAQLENLQGSVLSSNFVGLQNYTDYLFNGRTWTALTNTTFFTIVSVGAELIIGLGVALLINRAFKGRGIVRASVLVPWAIPTAVAAMMWSYLFDGQSGIVAHYMAAIGLISDPGTLLTTASGSMFSIIFADVWKTTPYMALLLLAGLQTIPNTQYEAAEVDGAGSIQKFFFVTLPLLKSAILVALLFRTLDAFRVFDLIYVLTGGGPANATESISVFAYKILFEQQNFGAGSALSVVRSAVVRRLRVNRAVPTEHGVRVSFAGGDLPDILLVGALQTPPSGSTLQMPFAARETVGMPFRGWGRRTRTIVTSDRVRLA